jgi:hypothetical protein
MSPADQIVVFMKGLKPDIRSACVWDPTTRKPFEDQEVLMGFAEAYDNALHHQRDQEPKASSKGTSLELGELNAGLFLAGVPAKFPKHPHGGF